MKIKFYYALLGATIFFSACNQNDDSSDNTIDEDSFELTENIEVYDEEKLDFATEDYVLAIENGGTTAYILNVAGERLHTWNFETNLGNDLELMDNGKLLGLFKADNPAASYGGYGGVVKIINPDGSIDWEYTYANEDQVAHHDVEMLPNGNIMFLVWERITATEAQQNGVLVDHDIFPEALIEINPATESIVWEWHSWDHIVQDTDTSLPNYGVISENPNKININYALPGNGDVMHANGIDYDSSKDVIYVSVNFYSEVWTIDHSTNTVESSLSTGGNYNKGGDLIYRFGNPEAYNNTAGERILHRNHFPNLLENGVPGAGHILIFNNGNDVLRSTVYELELPEFNLQPNTNNEPQIVWNYTNDDLFFGRISGAVRLANGNTLICEGDYGFWGVTEDKEIVWKYNGMGKSFWRCYNYPQNSEAIANLGL